MGSELTRPISENFYLIILVVSLSHKNDVSSTDPNLLAHLPSNVSQARYAIVAVTLCSSVSQHSNNLSGHGLEGLHAHWT